MDHMVISSLPNTSSSRNGTLLETKQGRTRNRELEESFPDLQEKDHETSEPASKKFRANEKKNSYSSNSSNKSKDEPTSKRVRRSTSQSTTSSNRKRISHTRFPKYNYCSNSTADYSSAKSPRKERKQKIHSDKEDLHEIFIGDVYNGRYEVVKKLGEGGFSIVVECIDKLSDNKHVAVKIQRKKYKTDAIAEVQILQMIQEEKKNFPNQPCHVINVLDTFEFQDSLAMVFPLCGPSLLDLLEDKYSKHKRFSLDEIRSIAKQLLETVDFIRDMELTHADIKPENLLMRMRDDEGDKGFEFVLVDFGLATFEYEEHNPVVGTRQYSPPEIIWKTGWSHQLDMWSIGCLLAELYLGRPLFQTHQNSEHLELMEKILGKIPYSIIKSLPKNVRDKYFHGDKLLRKKQENNKKSKNEDDVDCFVNGTLPLKEQIKYKPLCDLIMSMLQYDPSRRVSPSVALRHEFIVN